METRIIKAVFGASKSIVAPKRFKNDWGQVLELVGIELPQTFEAHFSNSRTGTAKKRVGQDNRVDVPAEYFESGADIFCWVMVHDGETDGRTMYTVRIPIEDRGTATDEEPTPVQQDVIEQAIAALNSAVEQTAQDVESADASAQSASDSADRAETARDIAEGYVSTVQGYARQAQASASNASASATASANSASQAQQIKTDVQGLVSDAQSAASASAQSATESAQSASQASTSATSASQSAETASTKASEASASAQTAGTKAGEASTSAQTASQKAAEASQSATQASGYATAAGQAKTAAETAQGLAEQAQVDAESAKDDAESARDTARQIVSGISGKVEQIDQNTADIASLEVDRYKAYATDTATGAVASFPDGADDVPMVDVLVNIKPVQDLHGYENPWPAGGGKNLLDLSGEFTTAQAGLSVPITALSKPIPAGTYTASITSSASVGWVMTFTDKDGNSVGLFASDTNNPGRQSKTGTLSDTAYNVRIYVNGATTISEIQFELGSTATAYAPYSNICPISGWNGANVSRVGKNLFDKTRFKFTTGYLDGNGVWQGRRDVSVYPDVDINRYWNSLLIDVTDFEGETITYSGFVSQGGVLRGLVDEDFSLLLNLGGSAVSGGTVNLASYPTAKYLSLGFLGSNYSHDNAQLELGSTATNYEPYTGNLYPVIWQDTNIWDEEWEVGIWSGSGIKISGNSIRCKNYIPVTNGTEYYFKFSEATFSRGMIIRCLDESKAVVSTITITKSSNITIPNGASFIVFCSFEADNVTTYNNDISINYPATDHNYHEYKGVNYGTVYGGTLDVTTGELVVDRANIASYNGETLPSTWISDRDAYAQGATPTTGAQVVYELATPITLTLTPTEIKSLLADNNIWADAGESTVTYRADTTLYINRKIAEAVSALS